MNEKLLASFSPSTQKALRALVGTPEDCVAFYNRVTMFRAALLIGIEVVERAAPDRRADGPEQFGLMAAAGASGALECTLGLLAELHPECGKLNASSPPGSSSTKTSGAYDHIVKRFENLD